MLQAMDLDEANRELSSLANTHHPELFLDTDRSLPSAIRRTELVVQRKFNDYANASLIGGSRNHIFQVDYGGRKLVLKQIPLEDKKSFEREVMVSHDLQHPNIVPVSAVFYDGLYGYIEMPLYPTTFRKWLDEEARPRDQVKPIMRQILHGVAYLHDHGIIHRDIKPDNICLNHKLQPAIIDFGISKDKSQLGATTTVVSATAGTSGYIAPEILAGRGSSSASDMWACGSMLYRALVAEATPFGIREDPNANPNPNPKLEETPFGMREQRLGYSKAKLPPDIAFLLQKLLDPEPHQRPSAVDTLSHPFFATEKGVGESGGQESLEELTLARGEAKITRLLDTLRQLQKSALRKGALEIDIEVGGDRNLVTGVTEAMAGHQEASFLRPWIFRHPNQDAAGGMQRDEVRDILHSFLKCVVDPRRGLFEANQGNLGPLGCLPVPGNTDLKMYTLVGRVLFKGILDSKPVFTGFSSVLFKHILSAELDISDAEAFDPAFAVRYRELASSRDICKLCLRYDTLVQGGEEIAVTDANKADYLAKLLHHHLIGQRIQQLEALREGFMGRLRLSEHFKDFSPADLLVLFGSPSHIDAGMVIEALRFAPAEWGKTAEAPRMLRELLHEATPTFLRRFLVACTGQSVVPASAAPLGPHTPSPRHKTSGGGLGGMVRVDRIGSPGDARQGFSLLPLEQRILLPDCSSAAELRAGLLAAMVRHCA